MKGRGTHCLRLALCLLVAVALTSCLAPRRGVSLLPGRNTVVFDQLALYSDFQLPQHHRLLDDLRLQRSDVLERLELPPSDEPIHVYLFDSEETFSRYLKVHHPEFPVRRAFFVESDTRLAVYAHWGDRVAEDLRHEVAHGYMHSVVRRIPLWLDEGLAEYFEVPRGSRGRNQPHVELLVQKMVNEGWRPNLERLEEMSSAGAMSQADYAESWAWAHLMLEGELADKKLLPPYFERLRLTGTPERLSTSLRRSVPNAEQALVAHLQRLASTALPDELPQTAQP